MGPEGGSQTYAPAYTFGRFIVRADAVLVIGERLARDGIDCSYIVVGGRTRLVIGDADEVFDRILTALPYCTHKPKEAEMAAPHGTTN